MSEDTLVDLLDTSVLDSLKEIGDLDFLRELVGDFLSSSTPYLATMRKALQEDDPASLHMAAHAMKSASANMGAVQLSELCKEIEAAGRVGDLVKMEDRLDTLESHYALVAEALQTQV